MVVETAARQNQRASNAAIAPEELRALRIWFDLPQERFGRALGVGLRTLIRYEKGDTAVDPSAMKLIRDLREIRRLAVRLHGSRAQGWLHSAHIPALRGRTPIEVIIEDRPSRVLLLLQQDEANVYS